MSTAADSVMSPQQTTNVTSKAQTGHSSSYIPRGFSERKYSL